MAYSGYENDVFISYAHVNDKPRGDAEKGWVTTFVGELQKEVDSKLGRSDACRIWMDRGLKVNEDVTPQLMDAVGGSALLVIILSPGYIESKWCQREKDTFLKEIRGARWAGGRVFLVELDDVDRDARPEEFKDRLTYKFWAREERDEPARTFAEAGLVKTDPHYFDYFNSLNRLAVNIAGELKKQSTHSGRPGTAIKPLAPNAPAAFVAEVTDDLEEQREELIAYLDQAGIRAIPRRPYVRDASFAGSVEADLAECKLFVQLLSPLRGPKALDSEVGYPRVQYEIAQKSTKPVLQWRAEGFDLTKVKDNDHRELLQSQTVRAEGIEDFKREVKRLLTEPPKPAVPTRSVSKAMVFVDGEQQDWNLAVAIKNHLWKLGLEVSLPTWNQAPDLVRLDLQENLKNCDALIVVYGNATATWVKSQLFLYRKTIAMRDQPLNALAVYQGPPGDQPPLNLEMDKLRVIECTTTGDEVMQSRLKQFIEHIA